jgi:NTP pyrophosphatase (non-canonical NTP hydrolase)
MPYLKPTPDLADLQRYVRELEQERGFTENTILQNALMLGEEMGELFKSIRKAEKMRLDGNSQVGKIEEEMADILIYLCSIANRYEIDLEKAFREKEEANKGRTWTA